MGKRREKWREHYILDDKGRPVLVDLLTWAKWFGTRDWVLRQETVGRTFVSTIFLGIDHGFDFDEKTPPVLWETMAFGKKRTKTFMGKRMTYRETIASDRCAGSKEQAEAMHAAMVRRMRKRERRQKSNKVVTSP